jgi:hypothetical protein
MRKLSCMLMLTLFMSMTGSGCATYFYTSSLNTLQPGTTSSDFLAQFTDGISGTQSPIRRAMQQQPDGSVVEVFTMPLVDPGRYTIEYWFLFKSGRLIQWGQPEDWRQVSGRYEISYNPSAAVVR